MQNKDVIVENLGNPKICLASPKVKDTRIFFANSLKLDRQNFLGDDPEMPHFNLRSSLLRLQNKEGIKQKTGKSKIVYFVGSEVTALELRLMRDQIPMASALQSDRMQRFTVRCGVLRFVACLYNVRVPFM